ncbi:MAG TPA: DUF732 domain-containing protein [Mycobacterium sp.]|jgi:hypothetical protein|nr:DUF732 domain-containing protein [Mycobacterium sp.]
MSTQTQAAAPDAGEPTVIVADDNATALAGLAWSDTDDDETFSFDQHDRTTFWLRLYVGTIAVVVVVLGVTLWYVLSQRPEPEPAAAPRVPVSSAAVATPVPSGPDDKIVTATTEPAPPPVITEPPPVKTEAPTPTTVYVPTPAPTPVTPHRSGADEAFIAALREGGIIVTDPAEIIAGGHRACEYIAAGHTAHDTMRLAIAENPTLTAENASILIGAAIGAYCPRYTGR